MTENGPEDMLMYVEERSFRKDNAALVRVMLKRIDFWAVLGEFCVFFVEFCEFS